MKKKIWNVSPTQTTIQKKINLYLLWSSSSFFSINISDGFLLAVLVRSLPNFLLLDIFVSSLLVAVARCSIFFSAVELLLHFIAGSSDCPWICWMARSFDLMIAALLCWFLFSLNLVSVGLLLFSFFSSFWSLLWDFPR